MVFPKVFALSGPAVVLDYEVVGSAFICGCCLLLLSQLPEYICGPVHLRLHSSRSATTGSTRVALNAGGSVAANAIPDSKTATAANVPGSVGATE